MLMKTHYAREKYCSWDLKIIMQLLLNKQLSQNIDMKSFILIINFFSDTSLKLLK